MRTVPVLMLMACAATPDDEQVFVDEPPPTSVERRVLHEMFSGSNCGPCLEADARVMAIQEANSGRYTHVAYQVGSDPYMSSESVGRRMYYLPGEGSYDIPFLHADGETGLHPNLAHDGDGYLQSDFDSLAQRSSPLELAVTHTLSGKTIEASIQMDVYASVASDDLVLHAAIVEGVTYRNVGSNGQTDYHDVMKKMMPDEEGTAVEALVEGETREVSLKWRFRGDYVSGTGPSDMVDHDVEHTVEEFEDLHVVVWVQDAVTWEVFQSASSVSTGSP